MVYHLAVTQLDLKCLFWSFPKVCKDYNITTQEHINIVYVFYI